MIDKVPASHRRVHLSTVRKLLYSLLVTAGCLIALECLLAAFGFRPTVDQADPMVGFSAYLPLFIEQAGPNGQAELVTAENKRPWFNEQRFPRHKAPDTYRIFCMGGSTTYGRPYDDMTSFCGWLREFLPVADRSRNWEVVNAGGISYASYRVARLMEELAKYEPDLFLIYTGHNEFLERRTYGHLQRLPAPVRGLGALAARTRIHAAMIRLAESLGRPAGPAETPGDRELLPAEVKTLLDSAIGPEMYSRDDRLRDRVLAHFELNLERMVDIARRAGADVIFVTPASNLRDCAPFKSQWRDTLSDEEQNRCEQLLSQARQAVAQRRWEEALAALDQTVPFDARHAELHYLRGRALLALERGDEARRELELARDEDICPLRALSATQAIVHRVARRRRASLVDFSAFLTEKAPQRIPGEEAFLDHVHPTIVSNRQLAALILDTMTSQRIVHPDSAWGDSAMAGIAMRVEGQLDRTRQAAALRNLSKVLAWAGKNDEADRLARRAVELMPEDAESQYQAGNAALREGDVRQALLAYQRSLELDLESAQAHYGLGLAFAEAGQLDKARSHYQQAITLSPDFADAHYNLAALLEDKGLLAEAESHYRLATRGNPQDFTAWNNLGAVMARQGRIAEAAVQFQKAVEINPRYADALANLGRTHAEFGDLQTATEYYRQALRYEPQHALARQYLDDARRQRGE